MAMIAITTSSSISVKPRADLGCGMWDVGSGLPIPRIGTTRREMRSVLDDDFVHLLLLLSMCPIQD